MVSGKDRLKTTRFNLRDLTSAEEALLAQESVTRVQETKFGSILPGKLIKIIVRRLMKCACLV